MDVDNNLPEDKINTEDLSFSSPDGSYSFTFSYWGNGIFLVKSKGFVNEAALKEQFRSGETARQRLEKIIPGKHYNLIWDVSEVRGGSLFARQMVFTKLNSDERFQSITLIGANILIRLFGIIMSKLVPKINYYFFSTYEGALQNLEKKMQRAIILPDHAKNIFFTKDTESYSHFIDLWQEHPNYITFEGNVYKITTRPKWQYISSNNAFKVKANVIEGNIVYFECIGSLSASRIDICYGILEDIMYELGFNASSNKFYTILNTQKVNWMTLGAKKRTSYYEELYKKRSYLVVSISSPLMLLIIRLLRKTNPGSFSHWETSDSMEHAFLRVFEHRQNILQESNPYLYSSPESPLEIPSNPVEMAKLIEHQYQEIRNLKQQQQFHIQKLLEVTGRMTWDGSFKPSSLIPDTTSPFNGIYNSLSVLFQDFREIIKEKQHHTQRLIESEDKYKNLINLANDIILVYQDDKVKFVNSKVKQSLGYQPNEIVGKSMEGFVAPEEITRLRDFHFKRIKGEEVPWIYETIFLHSNGSRVPISMSVGIITYENNPAAMVIARDITQKKQNEEELERYRNHLEEIVKQRTLQLQKEIDERKIAEESDRLKTAFLSNMSHEIRTPMNAILSFSKFLKDPGLSLKEREEYLNYIQSSGQSLLNLINDIIDISKIEAKQLNIQESPCEVNSLLYELHKLFEETRKTQQKNNITIKVSILDESKQPVIKTDPYRLKQILSNLLDNALKFTDTGSIIIGYTQTQGYITFFVKDSGIGIPQEKKDYIFKRFGKIESLGKNLGGTGLGLAISKHLSTLLKGKIWVESEKGKGSCFYLKLPFISSTEINNNPEKTLLANSSHSWNKKTILIAEDEELNYKVLQLSFRKTGATLLRATNGKEAIDLVSQNPKIDIVLMDIQMPVMDGYAAMSHPTLTV